MSILSDLIKKQEEDFYLRNTTFLNHIPERALRDELVGLYNSPDELARALGTIINAVYTSGKPTFYMSMRSLTTLLKEDKNLSYKGRPGIPSTNYRIIYAKLFAYFASNSTFTIVSKADQKYMTPACIQLHDQNTLLSMGNQIIIKLASNWHQQAIKHLSNMRKCYEMTKQNEKQQHITFTSNNNINTKKILRIEDSMEENLFTGEEQSHNNTKEIKINGIECEQIDTKVEVKSIPPTTTLSNPAVSVKPSLTKSYTPGDRDGNGDLVPAPLSYYSNPSIIQFSSPKAPTSIDKSRVETEDEMYARLAREVEEELAASN